MTTTLTHTHEGAALTHAFDNEAPDYENCVGAGTILVAQLVAQLPQLATLPTGATVCDNACGTGALTENLLRHRPDLVIHATDNSAGMVRIVNKLIAARGWQSQVTTHVMDSSALDFPADTFDAHIMNFGIFFTPDEHQTAVRIRRTTKTGGPMVLTCWKHTAVLDMLFDVQAAIQPAAPFDSLPVFGRWGRRETMEGVLREAGFVGVEMEEVRVMVERSSWDQMLNQIVTTIKGFVGNRWTEEETGKIRGTAEEVLQRKRGEYLAIDEPDRLGIEWAAWVASTRK